MTARTNLVHPTPIADLVPKRPSLVHGVVVHYGPVYERPGRDRDRTCPVRTVHLRDATGEIGLTLWGDEVGHVRDADRTWVVNARGDVWEITNRLRRTPPPRPLADPTHLFPAPTMRLPLVPHHPLAPVGTRHPEYEAFLDRLCSFVCEQGRRTWVVGPRGSVDEVARRAVPGPLGGTLTPASSLPPAPTLFAPALPFPAEAAHVA